MPFLFSYLLKFSLSLMVVYLFYQLVLRRLTFYQWNRFYLLGYSLLCFAIPFIHIDGWLGQAGVPESPFITIIPALGQYPATLLPAAVAAPVAATGAWGLYNWVAFVLLGGTVLMAGRLALLFISLHRLRRKSVLITTDSEMKLYETDAAISPFSFGRSVYFNTGKHSDEELEQIMRHEYVHIRQRHTVDLLAGELLCLVNWYNPFAWLMRYSIRQNLEFIADSKVLENGVDKKEYQYLLLKVVGISHYRIANHFNFSNLKKRIIMMNKMKSARLHLGRFLFVLPLLAVLLVAFRTHTGGHNGPAANSFIASGIILDYSNKQPVAGALVTETRTNTSVTTDKRGYYRLEVPMRADTPNYRFVASKEGYDPTMTGIDFNKSKSRPEENMIEVMLIKAKKAPEAKGVFFMSYSNSMTGEKAGPNPSYEDAQKVYKAYLQQVDDIGVLQNLTTNNPQVDHFYTTEDKKKQIVFLKDGGIEKYGYPGTPSIADMEKKYGKLPAMFTENNHEAIYYNKQWQELSDMLTTSFKPSGNAAKAILFPGDSRVLVQLPSNKMEFYDMDYQQDRDKFEQQFGKLPGLPPAGRRDPPPTSKPQPAAMNIAPAPLPQADTTPGPRAKVAIKRPGGTDTSIVFGPGLTRIGNGEPLILVDGMERADLKTMAPDDIESISVYKDRESIKKYGDKGKNGVILITTKSKPPVTDTMKIKAL